MLKRKQKTITTNKTFLNILKESKINSNYFTNEEHSNERQKRINKSVQFLIDRTYMNKTYNYSPENVRALEAKYKLLRVLENDNKEFFKLRFSHPMYITIPIDIDFFALLQAKLKRMTGKYYPADHLIHLLLIWFYRYYSETNVKKHLPFVIDKQKEKEKAIEQQEKIKLKNKFNKIFKPYYKNKVNTRIKDTIQTQFRKKLY